MTTTEVQQDEQRLSTSQAALRELADLKFALDQHAIVAMTDVQGTITYDQFCAISQYSEDELIGQNHRILNSSHHPKEFFQQMYHIISNGEVWHGEIQNRAKDGSIYSVDTTRTRRANHASTSLSALISPIANEPKRYANDWPLWSSRPKMPSSARTWMG
jgi:PAS domain S-box